MIKKLRKRASAPLSALLWLMLLALFPAQLSARDFQYTYKGKTLKYTVISEGAKTVKTCDGDNYSEPGNKVSGDLEIPSEVSDGTDIYSVIELGFKAFYNCDLTSVIIPNSVTTIGNNAFSYCKSLTNVNIPNSVTSIGNGAFFLCKGLTNIDIPNSVTEIGNDAFANCTGLTSVIVPNLLTSFGNDVFSGCTGLTKSAYPSTIKNPFPNGIGVWYPADGTYIFEDGCLWSEDKSGLYFVPLSVEGEFDIPASVTYIGGNAFRGCRGLTDVTIPNSVTTIGGNAFDDCVGLTDVTIPNSVTSILGGVFKGCIGLTDVTIGNSVTEIGDCAFEGCVGLTSIDIPNSVTTILWSAFYGCSGLKDVTIGNSVAYIGTKMFYGCSSLTSVTIGNSVTSIGERAFEGCDGLTSIGIPNSVKEISYGAFFGCGALTSVTLGSSVTSIGGSAFSGCSGLTNIDIPNSVKFIGKSAFEGCSGLTSITIGNSVTEINSNAFSGCRGLTSVIIPNSVTQIGENVFSGCTGLTKSAYPSSISNPFNYGIARMYPAEGNYIYKDGYIWGEDMTGLYFVPSGVEGEFDIPATVATIGDNVFEGCSGLTSVIIPNSVTSIGSSAFKGCSGLTNIDIPTSVTSIGKSAFSGCSGLTSVIIPNSVTTIGNDAFSGCSGLTKSAYPSSFWSNPFPNGISVCYPADGTYIFEDGYLWSEGKSGLYFVPLSAEEEFDIPDSVATIGNNAFEGCVGLTSVTIPTSVITIGNEAFYGCSGLTNIDIPNSVTSIGSSAFKGCSLTGLTIGNSVTSIGSGAFYGCAGLTSVIIPNSVTSIGKSAFEGCVGLTKSAYPSSISNPFSSGISVCYPAGGSYLFEDGYIWGENMTGLYFVPLDVEGEFDIPASVTVIGNNAFEGCSGLTNIDIPNSVTSIGGSAFKGCGGLTSVIIPNSVTSIDKSVFDGCVGLTKSAYPSSIWNNPFSNGISVRYPSDGTYILEDGCLWSEDKSGLYFVPLSTEGEFDIPASVATIGDNAFEGCSGLTKVTIPTSMTTIGSRAFYECSGLTSIDIPNSVTSIGYNAFYGCSGLTSVIIPNSVRTIGDNAFSGCSGLTKSAYPSSINNPFGKGIIVRYPADGTYILKDGCLWSEDKSGLYFVPLSAEGEFDIPASVTTIGDKAFEGCSGLTGVTIPTSVTSIGDKAFYGCSGLKGVIIPNSVTTIGSGVFSGCSGLTKSAYPSSMSNPFNNGIAINYPGEGNYIYDDGCIWSEDKSVLYFVPFSAEGVFDIPDSVASIGNEAFRGCSGLTGVTMGSSVSSIGAQAFEGCTEITTYTVKNPQPPFFDISNRSFPSYYAEVIVPDGSLTDYIVSDWNKFTNLKNTEGIAATKFSDNVFNYQVCGKDEVMLIPGYYSSMSTVSIPERVVYDDKFMFVTGIGHDAFKDCSRITTLVLPKRLKNIYDSSFEGCTGLTSVTLPATLTSIGKSAFKNCTGLKSLTFSDKLYTIGDYAFAGCTGLEGLTFNDELFSIGNYAFNGCTGLKSVTFNDGLNTIGDYSFTECDGLIDISFPNSLAVIGKSAFSGCDGLGSIGVGNLEVMGDYAFSSCDNLTSVFFGGDIESIGDYAFSSCDILTSVFFFGNIESIGDYAFSGCRGLHDIIRNGSFSTVGAGAFKDCRKLHDFTVDWAELKEETFRNCDDLTSVTLTNNVTSIGNRAFYDCDALFTMSIPASISSIGSGAFMYCDELSSFRLEDGLETLEIGNNALYGTPIKDLYIGRDYKYSGSESISTGISSLTYGNTVTSIPAGAFNRASGLKTVNFGSSIETIGAEAFKDCALTELVLPPHVKTIGNNAFAGNAIRNIAIGSEITEIGEKAFDGANSLAGVSITALTPPMANNNTFSYYDCPLYVTPSANDVVKDAYYNFTRCWYRFSGYDLIPADKVTIETSAGSMANIVLKPGETMKFSATMTPANASLPYIFWRSTNPAFATVDQEGNVTLVDNGISAQADDAEAHSCQIIAETLYADVVAKITVSEEPTGIDDVMTDGQDVNITRPNDIYNLQGICLKRNASQADIDALAPGLYIIAGKKVLVK